MEVRIKTREEMLKMKSAYEYGSSICNRGHFWAFVAEMELAMPENRIIAVTPDCDNYLAPGIGIIQEWMIAERMTV